MKWLRTWDTFNHNVSVITCARCMRKEPVWGVPVCIFWLPPFFVWPCFVLAHSVLAQCLCFGPVSCVGLLVFSRVAWSSHCSASPCVSTLCFSPCVSVLFFRPPRPFPFCCVFRVTLFFPCCFHFWFPVSSPVLLFVLLFVFPCCFPFSFSFTLCFPLFLLLFSSFSSSSSSSSFFPFIVVPLFFSSLVFPLCSFFCSRFCSSFCVRCVSLLFPFCFPFLFPFCFRCGPLVIRGGVFCFAMCFWLRQFFFFSLSCVSLCFILCFLLRVASFVSPQCFSFPVVLFVSLCVVWFHIVFFAAPGVFWFALFVLPLFCSSPSNSPHLFLFSSFFCPPLPPPSPFPFLSLVLLFLFPSLHCHSPFPLFVCSHLFLLLKPFLFLFPLRFFCPVFFTSHVFVSSPFFSSPPSCLCVSFCFSSPLFFISLFVPTFCVEPCCQVRHSLRQDGREEEMWVRCLQRECEGEGVPRVGATTQEQTRLDEDVPQDDGWGARVVLPNASQDEALQYWRLTCIPLLSMPRRWDTEETQQCQAAQRRCHRWLWRAVVVEFCRWRRRACGIFLWTSGWRREVRCAFVEHLLWDSATEQGRIGKMFIGMSLCARQEKRRLPGTWNRWECHSSTWDCWIVELSSQSSDMMISFKNHAKKNIGQDETVCYEEKYIMKMMRKKRG